MDLRLFASISMRVLLLRINPFLLTADVLAQILICIFMVWKMKKLPRRKSRRFTRQSKGTREETFSAFEASTQSPLSVNGHKGIQTIWPILTLRHIQIVLRLYSSPAEIFAGVDVDVTGIGYNGTHVWAAHRAFISFVTQSLKIDMFRRSASYEVRLAKYAKRGYEIFFPELRREAIDPMVSSLSLSPNLWKSD